MTKKELRQQEYEKNIFDNWHVKSKKGKSNFIVRFGVLSWGLSTFAVYWVLIIILSKLTGDSSLINWIQMIYTFVFFSAFGAVYGWVLWNRNEKIYRKKFPYGRTKK